MSLVEWCVRLVFSVEITCPLRRVDRSSKSKLLVGRPWNIADHESVCEYCQRRSHLHECKPSPAARNYFYAMYSARCEKRKQRNGVTSSALWAYAMNIELIFTAGRYTFKYRQSSTPSTVGFGVRKFFWMHGNRSALPFNKPFHGFAAIGFCEKFKNRFLVNELPSTRKAIQFIRNQLSIGLRVRTTNSSMETKSN